MENQKEVDLSAVRKLVQKIESVTLGELDSEKLLGMINQVDSEVTELRGVRDGQEEKKTECVETVDVRGIETYSENIRRIEFRLTQLAEARRKVYDSYQRILVREGMQRILGKRVHTCLDLTVLLLIVVVLFILFYESYRNYALDFESLRYLYLIDLLACTVFIYEFFLRLWVADNKVWFWKKNWIDLFSSIPIPPYFPVADTNTWFRTLRLVRLLKVLRGFRIASFLWRGLEQLENRANVRILKKSVVLLLLLIVVSGAGMQVMEGRAPSADRHVTEFDQGLWWSFNTVATGGFADLYKPQFILTQVLTAALLVGGIAVWGVFIAILANIFRGAHQDALVDRIDELEARIGAGGDIRDSRENEP